MSDPLKVTLQGYHEAGSMTFNIEANSFVHLPGRIEVVGSDGRTYIATSEEAGMLERAQALREAAKNEPPGSRAEFKLIEEACAVETEARMRAPLKNYILHVKGDATLGDIDLPLLSLSIENKIDPTAPSYGIGAPVGRSSPSSSKR